MVLAEERWISYAKKGYQFEYWYFIFTYMSSFYYLRYVDVLISENKTKSGKEVYKLKDL